MFKKLFIFFAAFYFFATHTNCKAQTVNWSDTLSTIVNASINDSLKVRELGSKIILLASNSKGETKDFLFAMEKIVLKQSNPHLLAEYFYSKAVVYNFSAKPEDIYSYADSCIYYATKAGNIQFIVRGNRIKGQYLELNGRLDEALMHLNKAYENCLKLNSPFDTYRTLIGLATIYEKKTEWKKAIDYAMKAAEVAEKNALNTLASVHLKIGIAYGRASDFENANSYLLKAKINAELSQRSLLDQIYANIGTLNQTFKKYDQALVAFYQTDSIMHVLNNYREGFSTYNNMGAIYTIKNQMDSAKIYFEKSVVAAESFRSRYLGRTYLNYSNFLMQKGEDSLALVYANKCIDEIKKSNDREALAEAIQLKASVLTQIKNYADAVVLFQESLTVKDSINQILKQEELGELLIKYETEKKENEITKLNTDKKIQQLQLEKQKALITGNLLAAKQKQQEIDLLNQQQQIQELKLTQQREALALNEIEAMSKDRQLKITEQEKQLKDAELTQQKFSKNLILAGAVVLLAFLGLGFNLYRINTKRNNEKEKFQLHHQLSEMKLEALRSQMNPHFIFNALNSINRYIIRSDKETASEYLIKFSKLMRLVLENSKSTSIPLQNELEALRLYVEMELLRFDNKFDFAIDIDDRINKEKVQIPPMVLQPFVENAIWHGLMNKKEKGNISIHVSAKQENKLHIVIEDNGIGRKKANELKNSTTHTGKSLGMQITKERINTLNGDNKNFKIVDLFDAQNNPAGTRVEIELTTHAA